MIAPFLPQFVVVAHALLLLLLRTSLRVRYLFTLLLPPPPPPVKRKQQKTSWLAEIFWISIFLTFFGSKMFLDLGFCLFGFVWFTR